MADLALSLASWTALSGNPTIFNVGTQYRQRYPFSTSFEQVIEYTTSWTLVRAECDYNFGERGSAGQSVKQAL